jgi:hypothetical protein
MSYIPKTKRVEDSVPKVNNELAVGSDPEFQDRWEIFERIAWTVFLLFIVASLAGAFGRGPLAQAKAKASDGSLEVKYERVQRSGTPSIMTIAFPQSSVQNDTVQLWADDNLVKPLGTQRVVPQPFTSVLSAGGILYTFPATTTPFSVEFQTQPGAIGGADLKLQVPGKAMVRIHVFVMP